MQNNFYRKVETIADGEVTVGSIPAECKKNYKKVETNTDGEQTLTWPLTGWGKKLHMNASSTPWHSLEASRSPQLVNLNVKKGRQLKQIQMGNKHSHDPKPGEAKNNTWMVAQLFDIFCCKLVVAPNW